MSLFKLAWFRFKSYLTYYVQASSRYNIQSPFFTKFIAEVLDTSREYYVYQDIEFDRKTYLQNRNEIEEMDFGAGRTAHPGKKSIRIQQVAKRSLSSPHQGRILHNLVQFLKPRNIVELGTSLGISTLYLGLGNTSVAVYTLEGNPNLASLAGGLFKRRNATNIQVVQGPFETNLSAVLKKVKSVDVIYLDGNHRKEPTLQYFHQILPYASKSAVFIVDDIRWSPDMKEAWDELKVHPGVTSSLELWKIGFLFVDTALSKENHIYIPFGFKPWRIGLFGN